MSMYRNAVLHARGVREYTRDGYLARKKRFNLNDLDVDLTDKVFVITGGNSGIGKCIATEIARRVGVVHLICRNSSSAEEARKEIVETTGNPHVHVHIVDMSIPRCIIKFAKSFMEQHLVVDVLINNASCTVYERQLTPDGLDVCFSTNTLGVHILTTELLPLLLRSSDPRVIMVTPGSMLSQTLDIMDLQFEKMQPYDGEIAYAQTKRQLVILTELYTERFPTVKFWSFNPGWIDTPSLQKQMPDFYIKMKDKLRKIEEGADTGLWLAVSQAAAELASSLFLQDRRPVAKHLPLAWTRTSKEIDNMLISELDRIAEKFYEMKISTHSNSHENNSDLQENNSDSQENNLDSQENNLDSQENNLDLQENNLNFPEHNLNFQENNSNFQENNSDSQENNLDLQKSNSDTQESNSNSQNNNSNLQENNSNSQNNNSNSQENNSD